MKTIKFLTLLCTMMIYVYSYSQNRPEIQLNCGIKLTKTFNFNDSINFMGKTKIGYQCGLHYDYKFFQTWSFGLLTQYHTQKYGFENFLFYTGYSDSIATLDFYLKNTYISIGAKIKRNWNITDRIELFGYAGFIFDFQQKASYYYENLKYLKTISHYDSLQYNQLINTIYKKELKRDELKDKNTYEIMFGFGFNYLLFKNLYSGIKIEFYLPEKFIQKDGLTFYYAPNIHLSYKF